MCYLCTLQMMREERRESREEWEGRSEEGGGGGGSTREVRGGRREMVGGRSEDGGGRREEGGGSWAVIIFHCHIFALSEWVARPDRCLALGHTTVTSYMMDGWMEGGSTPFQRSPPYCWGTTLKHSLAKWKGRKITQRGKRKRLSRMSKKTLLWRRKKSMFCISEKQSELMTIFSFVVQFCTVLLIFLGYTSF